MSQLGPIIDQIKTIASLLTLPSAIVAAIIVYRGWLKSVQSKTKKLIAALVVLIASFFYVIDIADRIKLFPSAYTYEYF